MPSADPVSARRFGHLITPWRAARGSVHSSYGSAINIVLGDQWCTVIPDSLFDGPVSIVLAEADFVRLPAVRAGDPAALRGASLRLGAARVDLRTAQVWRPGAAVGQVPGLRGRAELLRRSALARGGADWITDSVRAVLTDPACDPRPLIGRGIGLTPAGDDALVGALAAAAALGDLAGQARLAAGVEPHLARTTDLSAAFLSLACRGHFQAPVWQAALHVAGDLPGERSLLGVGATSGADCALGMSTYFESSTANDKVAA